MHDRCINAVLVRNFSMLLSYIMPTRRCWYTPEGPTVHDNNKWACTLRHRVVLKGLRTRRVTLQWSQRCPWVLFLQIQVPLILSHSWVLLNVPLTSQSHAVVVDWIFICQKISISACKFFIEMPRSILKQDYHVVICGHNKHRILKWVTNPIRVNTC